MNNFIISIKRFFANKNTVTIIGVIAIVGLLYWGYNSKINQAVSPVSIPVAKQTIQPRTLITKDMLEYVSIPSAAVKSNVLKTTGLIVGKYTNVNAVIPKGSMFYSDVLVKQEDLPDTAFVEVADGEVPYNFSVSMASTYANSMYPGNYVDFYMKAKNENGEIMVGKLIENVKILALKDASGKNVFENTAEDRTPSYMIFGVSNEIHILLRKATYLGSSVYSIDVFPVPHGGAVETKPGETVVSTQYLKDFINAITVVIDETKENSQEPNSENVEG